MVVEPELPAARVLKLARSGIGIFGVIGNSRNAQRPRAQKREKGRGKIIFNAERQEKPCLFAWPWWLSKNPDSRQDHNNRRAHNN